MIKMESPDNNNPEGIFNLHETGLKTIMERLNFELIREREMYFSQFAIN